jgi:hypothetical protein
VSVTNRNIPKAPGQTRVRIVGCDVSIPGKRGGQFLASPFFMEPHILTRVIDAAAELGAIQALVQTGQLKPYLKKAEAFRLYGRKQVEHWIAEGAITLRKDGDHSAAWRIDRMEVEVLAKVTDLLHYL